jgi:hypothetical protein
VGVIVGVIVRVGVIVSQRCTGGREIEYQKRALRVFNTLVVCFLALVHE